MYEGEYSVQSIMYSLYEMGDRTLLAHRNKVASSRSGGVCPFVKSVIYLRSRNRHLRIHLACPRRKTRLSENFGKKTQLLLSYFSRRYILQRVFDVIRITFQFIAAATALQLKFYCLFSSCGEKKSRGGAVANVMAT